MARVAPVPKGATGSNDTRLSVEPATAAKAGRWSMEPTKAIHRRLCERAALVAFPRTSVTAAVAMPAVINLDEVVGVLAPILATPERIRQLAEALEQLEVQGSTRLQQTVAGSLAAELRANERTKRLSAWRA